MVGSGPGDRVDCRCRSQYCVTGRRGDTCNCERQLLAIRTSPVKGPSEDLIEVRANVPMMLAINR